MSGLLDLSTMGWPACEYLDDGLRIGATWTIAELTRLPLHPQWRARLQQRRPHDSEDPFDNPPFGHAGS